jgi:hypothetical protein
VVLAIAGGMKVGKAPPLVLALALALVLVLVIVIESLELENENRFAENENRFAENENRFAENEKRCTENERGRPELVQPPSVLPNITQELAFSAWYSSITFCCTSGGHFS